MIGTDRRISGSRPPRSCYALTGTASSPSAPDFKLCGRVGAFDFRIISSGYRMVGRTADQPVRFEPRLTREALCFCVGRGYSSQI